MSSVVVAVVVSVLINLVSCTDRPIIGVLTQETKPWDPNSKIYKSYITASYVKAVEASGARVVPIFIDKNLRYYKDVASKVNGFLFPGGAANITANDGYARSGKIIYDLVIELNRKGDYIPILAVCLGMELVGIISNKGIDVRTPCPVKNEALNLDFLPNFKTSSLYSQASKKDIDTLSQLDSTSNHHRYCITQATLNRNKMTQWRVLSTSKGRNSSTFISSMEMTSFPIAAVQFHPEKNAFEWKEGQADPHDAESISASRLFYDWLVAQARLNKHSFEDTPEEQEYLIYNYDPTYTDKQGLYDTQDYYFLDLNLV